ncbi:MAG: hypothetical protein WAN37_04405, partial [Bryobacteraceae bacterium]
MRSIVALLPLFVLPMAAQMDRSTPRALDTQTSEGTAGPLKALETIPLPAAVKGRFDHFGVDPKHNRLFATPEDYHAVLVLALPDARPIAEIHGIARPHAILYRGDLDRIYVTDGVDGALK